MNNFFFVKIIKKQFADSLLSGNLYMQSLHYFREQESNNTKAQADNFEGTIGIIGGSSVENLIDNLNAIGQSETANFYDKLHDEVKAEIVSQMVLVEKNDFLEKIFCLYTFYFDSLTGEYQVPSTRLTEFAENAQELSVVIIHDCVEFLKRVREAVSKIGISFADKVRYKAFWKTNETEIFDGFCKNSTYTWQQEFRIACKEHKPSLEPLSLIIDDISDIAVKIDCIDDFFDPERFRKIMADNNINIKDYVAVTQELSSEEQDIPFCLLKEYELTRKLYLTEKEANIHYKEAADAMEAGEYGKAKSKLKDFKLMVQQEPYVTDCKPVERQLFWLYLRLVENLLSCSDKENLCYFFLKFLYFYKRVSVKNFNLSTLEKKRLETIKSKAEDCLKNFDINSFLKKDKAAGFAAMENATFKVAK